MKTKDAKNRFDVTNYSKTDLKDRIAVLYSGRQLTEKEKYQSSMKVLDDSRDDALMLGRKVMNIARKISSTGFDVQYLMIEKEEKISIPPLARCYGKIFATYKYDSHTFDQGIDRIIQDNEMKSYALVVGRIFPKDIILVANDAIPGKKIWHTQTLDSKDLKVLSANQRGLNSYNLDLVTLTTGSLDASLSNQILVCLGLDSASLKHEMHFSAPYVDITDIFRGIQK